MLPDRVSNPGPLTYESGALPIALRGPCGMVQGFSNCFYFRACCACTITAWLSDKTESSCQNRRAE